MAKVYMKFKNRGEHTTWHNGKKSDFGMPITGRHAKGGELAPGKQKTENYNRFIKHPTGAEGICIIDERIPQEDREDNGVPRELLTPEEAVEQGFLPDPTLEELQSGGPFVAP